MGTEVEIVLKRLEARGAQLRRQMSDSPHSYIDSIKFSHNESEPECLSDDIPRHQEHEKGYMPLRLAEGET